MTIQPLGERVLLEPAKKEEKTKGGLYIPEEAKKEKKEGTVLGAGTFKDGKALPLKKGDHVIYGGYSNEEIEVDGKKYLLVDYKDVIAKIER